MPQKDKAEYFDIKALFLNYLSHWWWFAVSLIVCGVLAVVYVKTHKPEYVVRANVIVTEDNTGSFTAMSGMDDLFGSSANVEDEVFVISSHSVLRDVARDLGVYKTHIVKDGLLSRTLRYPDFPVDVYAPASLLDTLRTTLTFKVSVGKDGKADITAKESRTTIADIEDAALPATVKTSFGTFVVNTTPSYKKGRKVSTTVFLSGYDIAAEDLAENTTSEKASKKSNMVELYMQTTNPRYGMDILNEIVANYNRRAIAEKNLQGEKTAAFIDERLALISGDLSEAESDIQNYKQQHGITDVAAEAAYNMGMRGTAEKELVDAETQSEIIRMAREFLRQPANAYEVIPAANGIPAASGAMETYNSLIMHRMALMRNAKGNNLQLKQTEEQINVLRESLNATLDRAYETSLVAIREARQALAKASGKLGQVPAQERQYLNLQRQQQVKQQLYLFLLQRREETAMMIANAIPKGRIVDEAYTLSEPVGPGKFTILAIALFIGLIIPCVLLYLKGLLRTKFGNTEELRQLTDVPVLGEICMDDSGSSLVVQPGQTSPAAELFRMVRSGLQFILSNPGDKTVLVTSTRPGEGKSFVSVNLAASLALTDKKVVLVGMDIRNPQLGNYLHLQSNSGVTNFLANPDMDIDALILKEPRTPGCDVILSGPVPPNPSEMLASSNVEKLFAELAQRYDYIVIDSAPVGAVSDTLTLSRVANVTVYVTRANYTTRRDIAFLNDIVSGSRLPRPSVVLNGVPIKGKAYGYGYGYGYSRSSGGKD